MKNTAKTAMRIQAERNPFREEIPEEARRTEALKAKKPYRSTRLSIITLIRAGLCLLKNFMIFPEAGRNIRKASP